VPVPSGATTGNVVNGRRVPSNGIGFSVIPPYTSKVAVSIDHTKVANTDQTNFPILIQARIHSWRRPPTE